MYDDIFYFLKEINWVDDNRWCFFILMMVVVFGCCVIAILRVF